MPPHRCTVFNLHPLDGVTHVWQGNECRRSIGQTLSSATGVGKLKEELLPALQPAPNKCPCCGTCRVFLTASQISAPPHLIHHHVSGCATHFVLSKLIRLKKQPKKKKDCSYAAQIGTESKQTGTSN